MAQAQKRSYRAICRVDKNKFVSLAILFGSRRGLVQSLLSNSEIEMW